VINYKGIVVSNKVQLAVVVSIVALLLATIVASFHDVAVKNFSPFFPNGLIPIGVSAALIFWSYLGYENVSNVAGEFENPKRDFHRSIVLSVIIVSALYVSIALMTVGTLAYKAGGSVAPFAAILSNVLGIYGAPGTAILAVFIIFGTVNAYMTGMSRVIYSVARDGGFPKYLAKLDGRTGAPRRSLTLLSGCALSVIGIFYFMNVDLQTALLIPSGAAIVIYVIGSIAGIKLLKGRRGGGVLPWISLAISLAVLPFVGVLLSVTLVFAVLGLTYCKIFRR
jgi:amino acid efflux transporter